MRIKIIEKVEKKNKLSKTNILALMDRNDKIFNKRIGDAFDEDSYIKDGKVVVEFTGGHFSLVLPYSLMFSELTIDLKTLEYKVKHSWVGVLVACLVLFIEAFMALYWEDTGVVLVMVLVILSSLWMFITWVRLFFRIEDIISDYKKFKIKQRLAQRR